MKMSGYISRDKERNIIVDNLDRYARVLHTYDQSEAKILLQQRDEIYERSIVGLDEWSLTEEERREIIINRWKDICEVIGHPYDSAFNSEGEMAGHFRRVLVDLKLLALTGNHTHPFWNRNLK